MRDMTADGTSTWNTTVYIPLNETAHRDTGKRGQCLCIIVARASLKSLHQHTIT